MKTKTPCSEESKMTDVAIKMTLKLRDILGNSKPIELVLNELSARREAKWERTCQR